MLLLFSSARGSINPIINQSGVNDYLFFVRQLSSNTESTASFESTLASTKDPDSATGSCMTCSTNTFTDSTIMMTEDPSSTDSSTISLPERTTMLPELALDNGNDENGDADGDGNKNASENAERSEDEATESGTTMGEKADIIEKNKATMHPFAVSTNARETLIPVEKLSENSTLIKVMKGEIIIRIFMQK